MTCAKQVGLRKKPLRKGIEQRTVSPKVRESLRDDPHAIFNSLSL